MNKSVIYPKEWLAIHPYTSIQPSDAYFVQLANMLYSACRISGIPDFFRRKLALYVAAYLEDVISGLGLWQSFTAEHEKLYGKRLPFYALSSDYLEDEINEEDIRFLIWNTWQKSSFAHDYIHPMDSRITEQAHGFYEILAEAFEEAPVNDWLEHCMDGFDSEKDRERKLNWLFGHSYLTEPSMLPYIEKVTPSDRFIIPVGPLALFLREILDSLTDSNAWKEVPGLYPEEPELSDGLLQKNAAMYRLFVAGTEGKERVYLSGYDALRQFLTEVLQWPDDENHTLPQMKPYRNFVLMVDARKGILLAKDICECIADPDNPYYDSRKAENEAFRLLTVETLCPPDLLTFCIRNQYLPDAVFPDGTGRELIQANADFIARHALLYYYRGD